jgi:hypothetical protein
VAAGRDLTSESGPILGIEDDVIDIGAGENISPFI